MHENLKTKQRQQNSSSNNSWVKRKSELQFHMECAYSNDDENN